MSTKKKLLEAAAGNAGEAVYVDDVFSTYLYEGTGSAQTITNGIDLDGEGGMVWIKGRNAASNHALVDTERGGSNSIASDTTAAERTDGAYGLTFNSNGFDSTGGNLNVSGREQVSWTFRKQPGFFDVVTYTGNGTNQYISHNLGSVPGCIFVKQTNSANNWAVYHRGVDATAPEDYYLSLERTNARADSIAYWYDTPPTDTNFRVAGNSDVNASGATYVAYLFAHNDGDGEFGESGDQDIIKCGSYTGNSSSNGPTVELGFEPQWILIKNADDTPVGGEDWYIYDSMRGITNGGDDPQLFANKSDAEQNSDHLEVTPTGFKITRNTNFNPDYSGTTYIYIAIRRPHKPASEFAATDLFGLYQGDGTGPPGVQTSFPVDWGFYKNVTNGSAKWEVATRLLQGKELAFESTAAEVDDSKFQFDYQDGWRTGSISSIFYAWNFRRAPGFFDVVAYTGDGQTSGGYRYLNHNLGVVPEMIWLKLRTSTGDWFVDSSYVDLGGTSYLRLNDHDQGFGGDPISLPLSNSTRFAIIKSNNSNVSNYNYIAYLFASVAGISKVGSYTGTGNDLNVDCGFTSGARFVLVKRTDSTGDWYVWDSARGIVAGNDPYLLLNSTAAEVTSTDYIDPLSSGFTVTSSAPAALNASGGTYIFLAIA